ncbi:hypothetical protein V7139_29285, partial [Neobacillus drentensis]
MDDLIAHKKYFQDLEEDKQLSFGPITSKEVETSYARQKFMIAICDVAPECQKELKLLFHNNYSLVQQLLSKTENRFPASIEKILPFKEGKFLHQLLLKWSNDWNINEEWMVENGWIAILSWFHKSELIKGWFWYDNREKLVQALTKAAVAEKRMKMDPEYPQKYNPLIHRSKKEFNKLNKKASKEKENQLLIKYGLKRTAKKEQRHFEWLVHHRLLKLNEKEIAQLIIDDEGEEKDIRPESIKKAIKEASNLV